MTDRVYLDHNATSPLRPTAREAMAPMLTATGNASSVHREGQTARARVENARKQVATLLGADAAAVTFTSGATELIALALSPDIEISGRLVHFDVLLISSIEHPAVQAGGRFPANAIDIVPVDRAGVVDLQELEKKLAGHRDNGRRVFVSIMAANNETGVVQPLQEIASLVKAAEGIFHVDAAQIVGRYPFDLVAANADLISISSHKLGGPQGAGALMVRDPALRLPPLLRGGGQERGTRAGTENVAAIVGFGAAAEQLSRTLPEEINRLKALRERLETGMRAGAHNTVIFSDTVPRVPNTTCFAIAGIAAETAVIAFDLEGVAVSAGAACSSGKVGPSPTLAAMKVEPEVSRAAVRVSLGWNTTEFEVERFLEIFARVYARLIAGSRTKAA